LKDDGSVTMAEVRLVGGAGNDIYEVRNNDVVVENLNEGIDTILSSSSYTLGANVENLTLTSNQAYDGTGNVLDNVLTGSSAVNTLTGNDGNDTLDGNTNNDTLTGGNGSDKYIFRRTDGMDTINETAGISGDTDTVKMTDGISETEPVIVKQNNDLYLFIDTNNYMRVTNQFYQPDCGLERLEVTDGYYITRSDIENIVNTMSAIDNDPGMDVIQKYNAMRVDQTYINTLAQSWHQA
jgi:Ca2+-binding RTX toxin-like protein